jgi:hypothetical protein
MHEYPQLQYEAAWSLTNIATGTTEQTQCLAEKGAIPRFIALMKSPYENLKEQAAWALGNIAGENTDFRDTTLKSGMLPVLLNVLTTSNKPSVIKTGCWALSNLVRGKPSPPFEKVKDVRLLICKRE